MVKKARRFTRVEGERFFLIIGHPDIRQSIQVEVSHVQPHAAIRSAKIIEGAAAFHRGFDELASSIVQIQEIFHRIIGDVHVLIAVAVKIRDQDI